MRNHLWTKVMIIGIISLLIGTSIVPNLSGQKLLPDELLPNETLLYDELDQENSDWNGEGRSWFLESMAQSFKPTLNMLTRAELIVYTVGTPRGNLTISIRENLSRPDLTSITIPVEDIPQLFNTSNVIWTEFDFPDIQVEPEQTYYIVLSHNSWDETGYAIWGETGSSDPYTRGEEWHGANQNWVSSNPGYDHCFKIYGYNFNAFFVTFGLVTIDGSIDEVAYDNISRNYYFFCINVSKVTMIGFGGYESETKGHFYMDTFTNVSIVAGVSLRKLEASKEHQHFSIFGFRRCILLIFEKPTRINKLM